MKTKVHSHKRSLKHERVVSSAHYLRDDAKLRTLAWQVSQDPNTALDNLNEAWDIGFNTGFEEGKNG